VTDGSACCMHGFNLNSDIYVQYSTWLGNDAAPWKQHLEVYLAVADTMSPKQTHMSASTPVRSIARWANNLKTFSTPVDWSACTVNSTRSRVVNAIKLLLLPVAINLTSRGR
jgi:hypothetical protein